MDNISCRLCLSTSKTNFKNIQEDYNLSLKIEDCVSVKVLLIYLIHNNYNYKFFVDSFNR